MHETTIAIQMQRWTSICAMALIAATYTLWIPQTVFPQVPVFEILCESPDFCDWIGILGLIVSLALSAAWPSSSFRRIAGLLVLMSLVLLISLDQHRFQPWAYQLGLFTTLWLFCRSIPLRLNLMRYLIIGIYFYSAVGKLDFEFLHSVGQQMLWTMAKWTGHDLATFSDSSRIALVTIFPVVELAIAIGLIGAKSRRVAGVFAIGLHLVLIAVLGPLGLNHRPGVLIWNGQFAVQAFLLFVVKQAADRDIDVNANGAKQIWFFQWTQRLQSWICIAMVTVVSIMPCTERFGIWDHWPSWALYAPHSSRVRVEVASSSVERLPATLAALIISPPANEEESVVWLPVPIDAWSLKTLDTPIYPQSRFQLGVARYLVNEIDSEFQIRITLFGTADRFTGQRIMSILEGNEQIAKSSHLFWLNSKPRGD
jgi:hypothetical protein